MIFSSYHDSVDDNDFYGDDDYYDDDA